MFDEVDPDTVWSALAAALLRAQVDTIRPAFASSVLCRVDVSLTFNKRTATVRTIWHYADENAAPRLVTAFPAT